MIQNKKSVLFATLVMATSMHSAFAADPVSSTGGTVQFTGAIIDSPCVVEVGQEGIVPVELGRYTTDLFPQVGATSPAKAFSISLENCDTTTYKHASLTFSGDTANETALNVEGGAAGVGIQIMKDGTALKVDGTEASSSYELVDGSNKLDLEAQYISIADEVTAGEANGTADFIVNYL
ncbi:fimbrial protein [Enterobacter wuhouensis]|uniref:fimbrial protein n=1 Tax=Enterobacter wuhouensis TaxID=2529381 RepID=UPI003D77488A